MESIIRYFRTSLLACSFLVGALLIARPGAWQEEWSPEGAPLRMENLLKICVLPFESDRLDAEVSDLKDLMQQRYGLGLEVVKEDVSGSQLSIRLELAETEPSDRIPGSYRIYRERSSIVIEGWDLEGLANGIYGFGHEILGARWYWPGEIGFEWVGAAPVNFPDEVLEETPVFVMRNLHPIGNEYGRRNRLISRYSINHALANIFTEKVFEESPEVFALINGKRRRPEGSRKSDRQPNLAHPKTAVIAAEAATDFFRENPSKESFSLSTNDNISFDDSEMTRSAIGSVNYFRGMPNLTDYVFEFNNRVAEIVFDQNGLWETDEGAARYLPSLAYFWTEQSPSIEVHTRVMPVLTSDRGQWQDADYRKEDKALIRRWADSGAETLAVWDYYFGAPYPYPRQFNQWIIESIPFLAENNVSVFFSQLPSTWGLDGAKGWLATQLLWDPFQDGDALLNEFYDNFFGAAAESVRAFYETAEVHRNESAGPARWIKFYYDEKGLYFSPEVLAKMRSFLDAAEIEVSEDPRRLARVKVVSDAFEYTERYYAFQRARESMAHFALGREVDQSVAELIANYTNTQSAFRTYGKLLVKEGIHSKISLFLGLVQSDPLPALLVDAVTRGALGGSDQVPERAEGLMALIHDYLSTPQMFAEIGENPGFIHEADSREETRYMWPSVPRLDGWRIYARAAEYAEVSSFFDQGTVKGIHISGADTTNLYGNFIVEDGLGYLLRLEGDYSVSPDNRVRIRIRWMNSEGVILQSGLAFRYPVGASDGFEVLEIPVIAPEGAVELELSLEISSQYSGDYITVKRFEVLESSKSY